MVKLLPGIDGIGKTCSFLEDLFGLPGGIPKTVFRYDPFDFSKPFFFLI
jgi:hypothetical protein